MRNIDASLTSALAAGTGIPYLQGTIGYMDGSVYHAGQVIRYKLTGQEFEFEMAYNGDRAGDQEAIWLERGVTIAGVNYTVTTGRFYIHSQHYLPNGHQVVKGGLFPKQYYAAAADVTYQQVIDAFCATYGKTAVYRDPAAAWLAYQFFPAGKFLILNDANSIAALLKQKYLIFYCDNGNEEILFYSCAGSLNVAADASISVVNDFYTERTTLRARQYLWRDEAGTVHTAGVATNPIHNLGYLESTAAAPARKTPSLIMQAHTRPDLRLVDGDITEITALGSGSKVFALITEQYIAPDRTHKEPRWETVIDANPVLDNTAGGALPSTIERVSNYTPLNTGYFNGVLSGADNNLQAAMDTLDDHQHYALIGGAASFNPAASSDYRFGSLQSEPPQSTANRCLFYPPRAGIITGVVCRWLSWGGVAGSGEQIDLYIRVINTTSYLVASVALTQANKTFSNFALSIPVLDGEYFELLIACPAWVTAPTLVRLSATIYIES